MNHEKEANVDTKQKRKIVRRHGACIECQKSKIKCDGDRPCGTCRTAKRKPKDCKYSSKAERAKSRRSHQSDNPLNGPRDGRTHESTHLHPASRRSRLPTPITPPEPAPQDPYSNIGNPLDWMCRPLVLSSIVEEYSTLVCPRSSHSPLFDLLHDCAKVLRHHVDSSHKQAKSRNGINPSYPEVKRSTRLVSPSCVASVWEDRLTMLQGQIENGELSRAQRNIVSLKKEIETYMTARSRAGQVNRDLQKEAVVMRDNLLELDYTLAMFLECQTGSQFWRKPGRLRPMLDHIKEGRSHSSSRIELLETLDAGMKLRIPDEPYILNFVDECLTVRPKQSSIHLSCITPYSSNDNTVADQEIRLFSSLFLMMLYCRTAIIERYCNHRKNQQGKSLATSNSTAGFESKAQVGASRAKSIEHQFIIKHANQALAAFHSLCENDREATGKSWLRLHGALTAVLVIGMAGVQKGKAFNDSNAAEMLPTLRECFRNLEALNPECILFQKADTIFDEMAKFQRRFSKTSETELERLPDMHIGTTAPQVDGAGANMHPSTTVVEDSAMNYENTVLPMAQYRHPGPPFAYPLNIDIVHPPMTWPLEGPWSTEAALPTGMVWYGAPTGLGNDAHMGNFASSQVLVPPIPQADAHNFGVDMQPANTSTAHSRFVNMTAESFEKDVATDIRMLVEGAEQMSQAQHGSNYENLATAQVMPSQNGSLSSPWQGYYPSQDSTCAAEFQKYSPQGNVYAHGSEVNYPMLSNMSQLASHPVSWVMNDGDQQQYNQLNVTQGSTTCW